jgi:hypothetical protein
MLSVVLFVLACSSLYERVPSVPGDTNSPSLLQPSSRVTNLVQQTGNAFGPLGQLAAGAAVIALQAGAYFLQKRATSKALADHAADPSAHGDFVPRFSGGGGGPPSAPT